MKNKNNKRKFRILIICAHYAPDYGPATQLFTALCEDLAIKGFEVTVVTTFPHYAVESSGFKGYKKLIEQEWLKGVRVIRTYVYTVPKSSLWRRLIYHGSLNIFAALAVFRVSNTDVILSGGPTLWCGLPLWIKGILARVPFIYIVYDIYPDVLYQLGVVKNKYIIDFINKIENYFYKKAARISVLSDGFKENLVQKRVPEEKIEVIPVCVDTEFIRPVPRDRTLSGNLGLQGKFVALYAGNIGFSQGLETVLEAARLLNDYPKVVFLLVGEGAMKARLQHAAIEMGLNNLKFLPFQDPQEVHRVYSLGDVGLVLLKRDIVVESVPSKTYSIMSSGLPVIATVDQNTEVGRLIKKADCGFCLEPENSEQLAQTVLRLYSDSNDRIRMGQNGRDFIVKYYGRKVAADYYDRLIEEIIKINRKKINNTK